MTKGLIRKFLLIVLLFLIIWSLLVGCSKNYYVRVYTDGVNKYELQKAEDALFLAKLLGDEFLIAIAEKKVQEIKNTPDKVETYIAKKIIESSSTSVRFIDKDGKEQFKNGKKIEIQEADN